MDGSPTFKATRRAGGIGSNHRERTAPTKGGIFGHSEPTFSGGQCRAILSERCVWPYLAYDCLTEVSAHISGELIASAGDGAFCGFTLSTARDANIHIQTA